MRHFAKSNSIFKKMLSLSDSGEEYSMVLLVVHIEFYINRIDTKLDMHEPSSL